MGGIHDKEKAIKEHNYKLKDMRREGERKNHFPKEGKAKRIQYPADSQDNKIVRPQSVEIKTHI